MDDALLPVSQPGDRHEQEADRVASQVMNSPPAPNSAESSSEVSQNAGGHDQRLLASERAFFEPRFGYDFSDVRIHTDRNSSASAGASNALAYTTGRDIAFGEGRFQPGTYAGQRLLAHELTHVIQQGTTSTSSRNIGLARQAISPGPPVIARQADETVTAGIVIDYEDYVAVFDHEFDSLKQETDANERRKRAQRLISLFRKVWRTYLDMMEPRGVQLALWLSQNDLGDEAQSLLTSMNLYWTFQMIIKEDLPKDANPDASANALMHRGIYLAENGRHTQSIHFLVAAWTLLQVQLVQATKESQEKGREAESVSQPGTAGNIVSEFGGLARLSRYTSVESIYDRMKNILALYPRLEREAEQSGDPYLASDYADLSEKLRVEIRKVSRSDLYGMGLETTLTTAPKGGQAIRFHGAEGRTIDVTPLPGQEIPEEAAPMEPQVSTMEEVQQSLEGQVDFMHELARHPEIEKAFKGREIDMNNRKDRLEVWKIMFTVYEREGQPYPEPLGDLMRLIGRYLKAFSKHTEYNIQDWGTSYLDQEMPVDLAGRVERDCGVFALTVAYDLFRTAKAHPSRIKLNFTIVATVDHAMLVIRDLNNKTFYVVSNDEIHGEYMSREGKDRGTREIEVIASLAPGPVRTENEYAFTPSMWLVLGSTEQTDATFRREVWQRYQDVTSWGLEPEKEKPNDSRDQLQRREAAYTKFYNRLKSFDRVSGELDRSLDTLSKEQFELLRKGAGDQELAKALAERLQPQGKGKDMRPGMSGAARMLADVYNDYSKEAQGIITTDSPSTQRRLQETTPWQDRMFMVGLLRSPREKHPLVRTAMALLRLQNLGGTLSQDDLAFIAWCREMKRFRDQFDAYALQGFPTTF